MAVEDFTAGRVYSLDPVDVARFWSKVGVGDPSECWPWLGYSVESGHGQFCTPEGTKVSHRVSYQLINGTIPSGIIVRHTCDQAGCCNPYHLISGTHADNVSDRVLRNRSARGESNGRSKLTAEDVRAIRADTRSSNQIAKTYSVDSSTIRHIRAGRIWKDI